MVQTGKVTQVLFKVTLCLEQSAVSSGAALSLGLQGNRLEVFGSHTGAPLQGRRELIPKAKDVQLCWEFWDWWVCATQTQKSWKWKRSVIWFGKGLTSLSSRRLTGDGCTPPASNEMLNLTNPYGA